MIDEKSDLFAISVALCLEASLRQIDEWDKDKYV